VLVRDISELRRRDRLLISMDATIREIHHRVKNNLQTISSLLRLQGRRLDVPEAKAAIEESVRRIRSIALVHEILSRETGDDVSFQEIVRPLVRMVEEAVQSPDRPVRFRVEGNAGRVPARLATPLAVVLTELLQNAVDHAFPVPAPGEASLPIDEVQVLVQLENDERELRVKVADNGVGLPEGFALESQTGLGLSIVRTLVTSQMEGSIELRSRHADEPPAGSDSGTVAELHLPVHAAAGE
jgi:two-component sensor histidine kinase